MAMGQENAIYLGKRSNGLKAAPKVSVADEIISIKTLKRRQEPQLQEVEQPGAGAGLEILLEIQERLAKERPKSKKSLVAPSSRRTLLPPISLTPP